MRYIAKLISWVLWAIIVAYRYGLSPVLGANCRYEPTCSAYAQEAIRMRGPLMGSWLALRRILRCHPWGGAGYDPVPDAPPCEHNHRSAPTPGLAKLTKN